MLYSPLSSCCHSAAAAACRCKAGHGLLWNAQRVQRTHAAAQAAPAQVRCAGCVWLVSLVSFSAASGAVGPRLLDIQEAFGGLLGDAGELTQVSAAGDVRTGLMRAGSAVAPALIRGSIQAGRLCSQRPADHAASCAFAEPAAWGSAGECNPGAAAPCMCMCWGARTGCAPPLWHHTVKHSRPRLVARRSAVLTRPTRGVRVQRPSAAGALSTEPHSLVAPAPSAASAKLHSSSTLASRLACCAQELASRGLSIAYRLGTPETQRVLLDALVGNLQGVRPPSRKQCTRSS